MREGYSPNRVVELKEKIRDNVGVNDEAVYAFCSELVALAKELETGKAQPLDTYGRLTIMSMCQQNKKKPAKLSRTSPYLSAFITKRI